MPSSYQALKGQFHQFLILSEFCTVSPTWYMFLSYTKLMKNQKTVKTGSNVRLVQVLAHKRSHATGIARALEQRRSLRLR